MSARGQYQTKQKEVIAEYFRQHPGLCMTAESVYQTLGEQVGMTTVYRAVARLTEEGFLRRYTPQSTGVAALYQLNPCQENHLHIRCVDCGKLAHLHCDVTHAFTEHLLGQHGFVLDESQTVLYGRCEGCEAKRKQEKVAAPDSSPPEPPVAR